PTRIHTLSLHDALPIYFTRALAKTAQRVWASDTDREAVELLRKTAKLHGLPINAKRQNAERLLPKLAAADVQYDVVVLDPPRAGDRKSTRLNSSHVKIS